MRTVNRSAIVPFSADAMFALVKDVEAYPEFLPWCVATTLQSATVDELVASLQVGFGAFSTEFSTRNRFAEPEWMTMQLVEGPFSSLEGRWSFQQLCAAGCEITLQISFDFRNPIMDISLGVAFEKICTDLVDAFISRAHALYD
jgi:ribosome-associated toxin RatA of RatAB toxin-antitoxin module